VKTQHSAAFFCALAAGESGFVAAICAAIDAFPFGNRNELLVFGTSRAWVPMSCHLLVASQKTHKSI